MRECEKGYLYFYYILAFDQRREKIQTFLTNVRSFLDCLKDLANEFASLRVSKL